jgi:hypothetical protein
MAISRMQQPRQMYGLGSFVKKAVKGVKSFVKSDLGKAAILGIGAFGLPGGALGMKGFLPQALKTGASNFLFGTGLPIEPRGAANKGILGMAKNFFGGEKTLGKTAAMFGLGGLGAAALQAAGLDTENPNEMPRDVESLKGYLRSGYLKLNPNAEEDEINQFVEANIREYAATGGRIGYAFGDVVDQASGIMGLPQRVNQAGVKELDLRETGGFIPPVGVKEKADDIPAMLSNNEFVFTAKSVKEMGDGDVNKGAQRMYDMMKYLEKGGRV